MSSLALRRRYGYTRAFSPAKAKIQTLLFPRDWSIGDALLWAGLNGFKTDDVDTTESHVRLHQTRAKGKAERVRTIPYGPGGLRAVVEWR